MNVKKALVLSMTVLSVAVTGASLSTTNTTAFAKAKAAKVIKTTNYKSKHKVHVRGGWMYSSTKLTHKNHHMTNYLYTKFYATKTVTVRKSNGKTATLKYIKSTNGKVKGYVHSTYVWNQWGYGKYSVTAFKSKAFSELNKERAAHGLYALKRDANLDKIAQKNSNRMIKEAGHNFKANTENTPHAGWVYDYYRASQRNPIVHYENGSEWARGEIYELTHFGATQRLTTDVTPYLLSKNHTRVGFGASQHGEEVYMFILLSHD